MSVKPELAFDVCWEVYRNVREVLEQARRLGEELERLGQVSVAAGHPAQDE